MIGCKGLDKTNKEKKRGNATAPMPKSTQKKENNNSRGKERRVLCQTGPAEGGVAGGPKKGNQKRQERVEADRFLVEDHGRTQKNKKTWSGSLGRMSAGLSQGFARGGKEEFDRLLRIVSAGRQVGGDLAAVVRNGQR